MLPLFIDHNFDHDILQGLYRRIPELNAITASEMELSEAPDPVILAWAAENQRVIVTHDIHTMPIHL
jgi:predicted nuclease of predicted toxin-antitoxin system